MSWATLLPLLFLFLSLLALAVIPIYLEREVSNVRTEVEEHLEPAVRLAARIQLLQVRQMAALRGFLLSGEGAYREDYRDARLAESRVLDSLQNLLDDLSLDVRAETAPVFTQLLSLSFIWHLGHQEVLNEEVSRRAFLNRMEAEGGRYREVLNASRSLREVFAAAEAAGRRRVEEARELQNRLTQGLAVLSLLATLAVLVLGARLRALVREAEKRRREALRARRETDALLRATGDGVMGMDREGRCTFLNRAGTELLGYPARLVKGRDVHDLLHHSRPDGSPYPREECPILRALETGGSLSAVNETLWRRGGEAFPVQVSVRALMDGPRVRGGVLTFTDMTEARAAEEELRQAIRTRDEVLAVVSHDLRNPVGTIYTTVSLLLDMEMSREATREHLEGVMRSAERMDRLIRDLLDVARMEAGAFTVVRGAVVAEAVLEETARAHRPLARESGVRLRVESPGGKVVFRADGDRLLQALSNLLENAFRFTPEGGEVVVGAREDSQEEEVVFQVSDSGPGIPPEDRERLFDRFWQPGRPSRKGGAGLGLSIVQGVAEAHGGRVWVESEEGEGTTFFLALPLGPDVLSDAGSPATPGAGPPRLS